MSDEHKKAYQSEAWRKQMMLSGSAFTIFISCVGIFGLSVVSAEKRTKEIGIRKKLGASVRDVVSDLSLDFLQPVKVALSNPVKSLRTD